MLNNLDEVFFQFLGGWPNLWFYLKLISIELLLEEDGKDFDDSLEFSGGVSDVENTRIELCEDRGVSISSNASLHMLQIKCDECISFDVFFNGHFFEPI